MPQDDPTIKFIEKQENPVWALVFTKNDASFYDEDDNLIELTDEQWERVIKMMDKVFPMDNAWEVLHGCIREVQP